MSHGISHGLTNIAHWGILCDHVPDLNIDSSPPIRPASGFSFFLGSMKRRNDSRNLFRAWQIGKRLSMLDLTIISPAEAICPGDQPIPLDSNSHYSCAFFTLSLNHATPFHNLSRCRCTGHLSYCKADGQTRTANLILTRNLHCHCATPA